MSDQTLAARLRKSAAHSRAAKPYLENSPVLLTPDEADALADMVEAATALGLGCASERYGFWVSFTPDGGPTTNYCGYGGEKDQERTACVIERFRAALAAFDYLEKR